MASSRDCRGSPPEARERLLAIVYEIEREQGFGWYFGDEEETA